MTSDARPAWRTWTSEEFDLAEGIGAAVVVDTGASGAVTAADPSARVDDLRTTRRVVVRTGTSTRVGTPSYWTAITCIVRLPLPLAGLDGSPARVVALEPVDARPGIRPTQEHR